MTDVVATLSRELGAAVHTEPEDLRRHARDTWVLSELRDFESQIPIHGQPFYRVARSADPERVTPTVTPDSPRS